MYSLFGYEKMIDDKVRMAAYYSALERTVQPGDIVLDIGAGTGLMSMLACQFGARHVYSIEPDNAIAVAKENALANGMQDRITFIQGLSTQIELPEKANVIVSDLRGVSPLFTQHIESIKHARENHLASGGVMIPQQDKLWVALAETSSGTKDENQHWDRSQTNLNLSAIDKYLANSWRKDRVESDQLLTDSACWATLDYRTMSSPDAAGKACLTCNRNGVARGIVAWFETELIDEIGFSNAPGKPVAIYGMQYFPLLEATDVCQGDQIEVQLTANVHEQSYLWQWETRIHDASSDRFRAEFKQSSFNAIPFTLKDLQKGSDRHVPQLDQDGCIDHFILSQMQGHQSVGEIAVKLEAEFPEVINSYQTALNRVAGISKRYSK